MNKVSHAHTQVIRDYQTPPIPYACCHSTRCDLLHPSPAGRKGMGGLLALSPLNAPASAAELACEGGKGTPGKERVQLIASRDPGKSRDLKHDFES